MRWLVPFLFSPVRSLPVLSHPIRSSPLHFFVPAPVKEQAPFGVLEVLKGCKLEPSLKGVQPGSRYQFERLGYFCADPDSTPETPVFNRTVALRDTWAKIEKKSK